MFILDIPDVPPQYGPVLIAQAPQDQQDVSSLDLTLGACQVIDNPDVMRVNGLSPVLTVKIYLGDKIPASAIADAKVSLLLNPKHGTLVDGGKDNESGQGYVYKPEAGYLGKDTATMVVEIGGYRVKLIYSFHLVRGPSDDEQNEESCPQGFRWKISSTEFTPTIQVADLANGALASTSGTTITLDDNAAGHDWYVDSNWLDNSEWLPTSNPNEWKAREGSDAYGKMDLLSVLLHEYGHVLGIEHSTNSGDYMSTTLSAGTRKLPSPEEMQLMANLVAGVKDGLPSEPGLPLPSIPLALGALAFARRRDDVNGSTSVAGANNNRGQSKII